MMCRICRYVDTEVRHDGNGNRTLYETRTGNPHNCDYSTPKCCPCGVLIFLDNKVLSLSGKMIPLEYESETYHFCDYGGSNWKKGKEAKA